MILFALSLLQAAAPATFPPDAALQRLVDDRVHSSWTTGIIVGVLEADGSRRVFAAGSGAGAQAPDSRTVFEIGSITKAYTGILLAEMAARGEVRLEDPVSGLLPSEVTVPARDGKPITLLDLATHRSGLPRLPTNMSPADQANPYADYSVDQLYAFLNGFRLPRDPGAAYTYSNLGAGLLGHALALRAGKSYEQLLTERVLAPLELDDTRITLTPGMRGRLAPGHDGSGNVVANWDIPTFAGAGALRSTVDDQLDFLAANVNGADGTLGTALREARAPRREAGAPVLKIGLGWHILSRNGHEIVWHNGGTGGYRTFVGYDPARRIGVVVLTNANTDNDDIGFHLLGAGELAAGRSVIPVTIAPEILQRYVGTYELTPQFRIAVTREDDRLYIQATNQPRFAVFPTSEREFLLRAVEARIVFEADGSALTLHQGGGEQTARRVP